MNLLTRLGSLKATRVVARAKARGLRHLKMEATVAVLLALTAAAAYYQDEILDRRVIISAENVSQYTSYTYSDADQGGRTKVAVDTADQLAWTCRIAKGVDYPFCGFGLLFDPEHRKAGLKLTDLDEVKIDLTYHGEGRSLTLFLKNYDIRYSRPDHPENDKYNQVDFPVRGGRQTILLSAKEFAVPDWWIANFKIPPQLSRPQFDNVLSLEIAVSSGSPLGVYSHRIHSISFSRPIMSRMQWHACIAGVWLLVIGSILFHWRLQERRARAAGEKNWQKTLDSIPQMVWAASENGDEYYNAQWAEFTGTRLGTAAAPNRIDLVHPDDRERVWARWQQCLASGADYESEYRLLHRSGEYRWVLSRGLPEQGGEHLLRWYGTCTDIHDRVLAAQALDASESLNRGIIEAIPDRVSLLDLEGHCLFANRASRPSPPKDRSGGQLNEELLGSIPAEARLRVVTAFNRARSGLIGRTTVLDQKSKWWDIVLAPVFGRSGSPFRIVMVSRDVTEQKAAEEKAHWNANHDGLTRLANRTVLQKRLDEAIAEGAEFALLLFDVDDFKLINDTAGHDAGDALLCAFAKRLIDSTLPGDTVTRLGGDEFAVILTGLGPERDLNRTLDAILSRLREPCTYNQRVFDCRASIGVTLFPGDAQNRARLLKNADVALYSAKKAGKGNFQLFKPSMRTDMAKRGSMTGLAREALQHKRIMPYYQPKLDLRSGAIDGFEALLRWRHPRKGIQNPATIAAAFDDLALAAEMSDAIIDGVVRDIRQWRENGVSFGHVAINAAAAELRRDEFADRLLERLHAGAIPPSAIQLEVTETVFLGRGAVSVERALKTLSMEGVQIALDDFGTGYASLAHLKQFPVDIIKIDRSFIRELQHHRDNAPIVDAVINLGRSLGIKVVAEGIETAIQHHFLVAKGCDYGQGHLYSPAVPADEAAMFARSPRDLLVAAA